MTLTHGSLFSGIGGFDLASEWAGIPTLWQIENDSYCQRVLRENFPNTKLYEDIYNVTKPKSVDIVSGGFPCQPFSITGKKQGTEDDRYLWDEMFRIITEVQPPYVIAENVYNIINVQDGLVFQRVLNDMESQGYKIQPFLIPACSVGAWHKRDRWWFVAYSESFRRRRCRDSNKEEGAKGCKDTQSFISSSVKRQGPMSEKWWEAEPRMDRMVDGLPNRVDRIEGLGNSIVPKIAYNIFLAIKLFHNATS